MFTVTRYTPTSPVLHTCAAYLRGHRGEPASDAHTAALDVLRPLILGNPTVPVDALAAAVPVLEALGDSAEVRDICDTVTGTIAATTADSLRGFDRIAFTDPATGEQLTAALRDLSDEVATRSLLLVPVADQLSCPVPANTWQGRNTPVELEVVHRWFTTIDGDTLPIDCGCEIYSDTHELCEHRRRDTATVAWADIRLLMPTLRDRLEALLAPVRAALPPFDSGDYTGQRNPRPQS